MRLTRYEFRKKTEASDLSIAFIGMSNAGKSRSAQLLKRDAKFSVFSVDAFIQNQLSIDNIDQVADWLGDPTSEMYADREAQYLSYETIAMREGAVLKQHPALLEVLDTTGSCVYADSKILQKMKERWLIVNIEITDSDFEVLYNDFITHPKPIIWSGFYSELLGETKEESLKRSYRLLLNDRRERYMKLADVNIPRAKVLNCISGSQVLDLIESYI